MMFRHHDADHPHLHILVNRIGFDGTVVSDSNDYARSEKVLRALEKTGAKLGNDFKWSSIKNNINYEQERDRTTVHEANARSKSTIDQLRTGNGPAQGNRANTQQDNVQYRSISDSTSNFGKFVFRPSFQIARLAPADREFGRAVDNIVGTVIKIPKVLPLATLLDSNGGGNHIGAVNQPAMDDSMKQKPKKKKKKRLKI